MCIRDRLTTVLAPGIVTIHNGDEEKIAALHSGFAEILGDKVTFLAELAEWPDEIDIDLSLIHICVIFGFNCFILAIFGFMFGWDKAAYSIVFQFISTKTCLLYTSPRTS